MNIHFWPTLLILGLFLCCEFDFPHINYWTTQYWQGQEESALQKIKKTHKCNIMYIVIVPSPNLEIFKFFLKSKVSLIITGDLPDLEY